MKRKTKSEQTTPDESVAPKPQRVEIVNERGEVARPFEHQLQPWFDKGWKLKEQTK